MDALLVIYNSITSIQSVPSHFKKAIIIPVSKGKDKDPTLRDNYRGISLLTVLSKVYEQLLLVWYNDSIELIADSMPTAPVHTQLCYYAKSSAIILIVVTHYISDYWMPEWTFL